MGARSWAEGGTGGSSPVTGNGLGARELPAYLSPMKGEFNLSGRALPRPGPPPGLTPAQCRAARALLGWTQQQLADAARVARATVRDFEGGRHPLHRSTEALVVAALARAGVTLAADPALGEGVFLR